MIKLNLLIMYIFLNISLFRNKSIQIPWTFLSVIVITISNLAIEIIIRKPRWEFQRKEYTGIAQSVYKTGRFVDYKMINICGTTITTKWRL